MSYSYENLIVFFEAMHNAGNKTIAPQNSAQFKNDMQTVLKALNTATSAQYQLKRHNARPNLFSPTLNRHNAMADGVGLCLDSIRYEALEFVKATFIEDEKLLQRLMSYFENIPLKGKSAMIARAAPSLMRQ